MDILIVKPFWGNKILENNKLWEIRGTNTSKRGKIGIAKSGTGYIFGTVNIIDSISLTEELWEFNRKKHQVDITWNELLKIYKNPHAWVFEDGTAMKYHKPIPYKHPKGAVVWVKNDTTILF